MYKVVRAIMKGVIIVWSLSTNVELEMDRTASGIFKQTKSIKHS